MFKTLTAIQNYLSSATLIRIEVGDKENFLKEVRKFQKKAERFGLEPITVAEVGDVFETTKTIVLEFENEFGVTSRKHKMPVKVQGLSISGGMPKIEGYEMLGVLTLAGVGVIVKEVPGQTIPEAYRTTTNKCDHCNKNRARGEVVVLRETATGRTLQVGKQCCRDFIGYDMSALTFGFDFQEYLYSVIDSDSESECGGGGGGMSRNVVSTEGFLAAVSAALRDSKGNFRPASFGASSTRTVASILYGLIRLPRGETLPVKIEAVDTERAKEWIATATAAFAAKQEMSNFEHNLNIAVTNETVPMDLLGILAALPKYLGSVAAYTAKKTETLVSTHQGAIGDKVELTLTFLKVVNVETAYGSMGIYMFKDQSGNMFVWKTGTGLKTGKDSAGYTTYAIPGDVLRVKATIKAHDTYKDTAQTLLTRVSVVDAAQAA